MSGGMWAWAIMSIFLVAAYLTGVRSYGISGGTMLRHAAIWAGLITVCYFVVSWLTGAS